MCGIMIQLGPNTLTSHKEDKPLIILIDHVTLGGPVHTQVSKINLSIKHMSEVHKFGLYKYITNRIIELRD